MPRLTCTLARLRIERDRLGKFSDYGGLQKVEEDAVSRAEVFMENASRVRAMAAVSSSCRASSCCSNLTGHLHLQQARKNSQLSLPSQHPSHPRASSTSVHRPSTGTPASRRVSSEQGHASAKGTHSSLSRVSTRNNEPLEMSECSDHHHRPINAECLVSLQYKRVRALYAGARAPRTTRSSSISATGHHHAPQR